MQCSVMHQVCDGFYCIRNKHLKLSQKNGFPAHFERFFFMPSYALSVTPQSYAIFNALWSYILALSFISLAFVAVKL